MADAWTITINFADVTPYVDVTTILIRKKVGFRRATAQFVVRNLPASTVTYKNWQRVQIFRDTTLEFGGLLMAYDYEDLGVNRDTLVTCVDYSVLLDATLTSANSVYPINVAGQTVVDLIAAELPEITADLVDDGGYVADGDTMGEIILDYRPVADVIRDLAAACGFTYYVKQSGVDPYPVDLYFHAVGGEDAPFGLTTNSPDEVYSFPMRVEAWSTEGTSVRNKVYIQYADGVVSADSDASQVTYGFDLEMIKRAETADATYATVVAQGLLGTYSEERETGKVVCWEPGLEAGMRIHIEHVPLEIDDDYIIQEIEIQPDGDKTRFTLQVGEMLQDPGLIDRLRAFDSLNNQSSSGGTAQLFVGRREGPHVGLWRTKRPDGEYNIYLNAADTANGPFLSVGGVEDATNSSWISIGYADPVTGKAPIRLAEPEGGPDDSETRPRLEIDASTLVGDLPSTVAIPVAVRAVVDTTTETAGDGLIVCNKGTAMTVNLLAATGSGRRLIIKSIGAGAVTVDGADAETIDGETTQVMAQWDAMQLIDYAAGAWVIV